MKKLLSLIVVAAMVMAMLCGCGGEQQTTTANNDGATNNSDASGVTDGDFTTATNGVLTMATNAYFPPYEYYEGEEIVGIDAEVAQAIADKLGLTLDIQDMEFGSIITAVQTGKVDIGLAGMTVTEDRLQSVDFTTSYATGIQSVIVLEGSEITSVDDLAGHMIGVQLSTTGDLYALDDFGAEFVEEYNKGADAVLALIQGKVDAVIIDNEPAKNFVSVNEGLIILDTEYAVEDYAACISKDNPELMAAVNAALEELIADGTIQAILDKYITAE